MKTVAVIKESKVVDGRVMHICMVPHLQGATSTALQPAIQPPGETIARTSQPAMTPGTIVYVEHPLGAENTTYWNIVGNAEGDRVLEAVPEGEGNNSWWTLYKELLEALNTARPNVETVQKLVQQGSPLIHEIQQVKDFKLSNFFGFGANLADKQFNRINVSNLKQIPTALASASSILGSGFSLPGTSFSLGNLLNLIPDKDMKDLENILDPQILQMLMSYLNNIVDVDDDNGIRCDIDTFIANIIAELKLVKTKADLRALFDRIENDETLRGLDLVKDLEVVFETAYGSVTQKVSANGNISQTSSDGLTQALSSIQSLLSGLSGAVDSFFSGSNPVELANRHSTEFASKMKDMLNKLP